MSRACNISWGVMSVCKPKGGPAAVAHWQACQLTPVSVGSCTCAHLLQQSLMSRVLN